ncbi:hypothetical protein Q9Q94_12295 [Uliginosibacterium sp. 31-16]|uniref:hypothetical protein n=1 Tax=Uliginosibacterium sp. 31-16 TaxID=3068315 RepID=UPI00273EBABE|nr:hypothetical protein [Uliginosibacterium sp. 31-16]MDP5240314.1 hypothetical protein [Uliginosibacterium sp. 31-16]
MHTALNTLKTALSALLLSLLLTACGGGGGGSDGGTGSSSSGIPPTSGSASTVSVASQYTSVSNYTFCSAGTCSLYSTTMGVNGSFKPASPLAANLTNQDISASLESFSFSDGINTYASTDSSVRVFYFQVTTDANARITALSIKLQQWKSGVATHVAGDRYSEAFVSSSGGTYGHHNWTCNSIGISQGGAANSCIGASSSTASSEASAGAGIITQ